MVWNIFPTKEHISFSKPNSLCDTSCSLCSYPVDSLYHIFFICPIARIVWRHSFWSLDITALPVADMTDWIQIFLTLVLLVFLLQIPIYFKFLLLLLVIVYGLLAIKLIMITLSQMLLISLLLVTGLCWNISLLGLLNNLSNLLIG
jgi:hypothetical protein